MDNYNALSPQWQQNALSGAFAGGAPSNALARPSPLSWDGMRDNLSNLYHAFAETGLYLTPAGVPLAARDAFNEATRPVDESKLSPMNAQGNRLPDLSTGEGWKNGLSDLYHSGSGVGLALTGMARKFDPEAMLEQYGTLTPWSGWRGKTNATAEQSFQDQLGRQYDRFQPSPPVVKPSGKTDRVAVEPSFAQMPEAEFNRRLMENPEALWQKLQAEHGDFLTHDASFQPHLTRRIERLDDAITQWRATGNNPLLHKEMLDGNWGDGSRH